MGVGHRLNSASVGLASSIFIKLSLTLLNYLYWCVSQKPPWKDKSEGYNNCYKRENSNSTSALSERMSSSSNLIVTMWTQALPRSHLLFRPTEYKISYMLAMSIPKGIPKDCNMFWKVLLREREKHGKGEKGLEYSIIVAFRHTNIGYFESFKKTIKVAVSLYFVWKWLKKDQVSQITWVLVRYSSSSP